MSLAEAPLVWNDERECRIKEIAAILDSRMMMSTTSGFQLHRARPLSVPVVSGSRNLILTSAYFKPHPLFVYGVPTDLTAQSPPRTKELHTWKAKILDRLIAEAHP